MRLKSDGSYFSSYVPAARLHSRGLAVFLLIVLVGAGYWVSPAVAAYVDIVGGSNVIMAVPVAQDDAYSVNEDTALVRVEAEGVLSNDSDSDADPLTAVLDADVVNGTLVLSANGSFTYTPDPDFSGIETFTYHANDGSGDSNIATVTITVDAVNDAPSGAANTISISEDDPYTLQAGDFGFSDPNDSPANGFTTVKITTLPVNGVLELLGSPLTAGDFVAVADLSDLVFTPAENINGAGAASFTFQVRDDGGTANAGIDLDPSPKTLTFDITAVNDAPVAVDDAATTSEETLKNIVVLANDTDIDGGALSVSGVTNPPNGTAVINGVTVDYTPDLNFNGEDTFTYTVSDGAGGTDTGLVTVTVTGVNDAPVAVDDVTTTAEETLKNIVVLANDTDVDGDTLSLTAVSNPSNGTAVINGVTVDYTPDLNYNGVDNFTYTMSDGAGGTDTGTVTVTVTGVNDAPVAVDDTATTSEETLKNIAVLANDTDVDGNTLSVSAVSNPPNGSAVINGVTVNYTPDLNFNGEDTFTYTVSDGAGGTDTGLVTVTVTGVNDAPVAVDDAATTSEETLKNIVVLANDTDVDGDTLSLTAVSNPPNGTAVINGVTVDYTPDLNYNGVDTFTYTVSDGAGGTDTGTVTVTVTGVNDPPVAVDDTATTSEETLKNIVVLANDTDVDGNTLSVSAVSNPPNGTAVINGVTVDYTPDLNYNGVDTFTYIVSDGAGGTDTGLVTVTVTGVNDPPVAVDDIGATTEDNSVTIDGTFVLVNDTDPEGTLLTIVSDFTITALNGTVSYNPNPTSTEGKFTFVPTGNYSGPANFQYQITDGSLFDIGTVTITVAAVNDAPVAVDDAVTTSEETLKNIAVLANDTDIDGGALSVSGVTNPPNGTAVINGVTVDYTPDLNFNGEDTFTYTVSDGAGGTDTGLVTVTVTAVNDAPVAAGNAYQTNEDSVLNVIAPGVLAGDNDVEGTDLTASLVAQATKGTAAISLDGSFTYTPTLNLNGSDSFTYKANDGLLDSNIATVTIEITPNNDPPVLDPIEAKVIDEMVNTTFTATASDIDTLPANLSYSLSGSVPVGASISAAGVFNWNPVEAQGPQAYLFSVCVSDGFLSDCQEVDWTVREVNRAPLAVDDTVQVLEGSSGNVFTPLSNDTDPDLPANTLWLVSVLSPSHGGRTWDGDLGTVTYTPTANYAGADAIAYGMADAAIPPFLTSNAQILITVLPVNDAPAGAARTVSIAEDGSYTFSTADFPLTDPSDSPANGLAGVKINTLPAIGSLTFSDLAVNAGQVIPAGSLGSLKYTPPINAFGTPYASFTFQVQDDGGVANGGIDLDPTPNQFTFNVTPVPDNPVGNPDAYAIGASTPLPFTVAAPGVLANDSDGDGFSTWSLSVFTQPAHGTVALQNNGSFTYTPTGTPLLDDVETFVYRITDTNATPSPKTVDVTVTLTVDRVSLTPDQVAQWVLPYPYRDATYSGTNETIELRVLITNPTDVDRIEFKFFDHTQLPEIIYVLIGKDFTPEIIDGKYYYSVMLDLDMLPVALNVQVFAYTYDSGNNNIRDGIVDGQPYLSRLFINHTGTTFLPVIMR